MSVAENHPPDAIEALRLGKLPLVGRIGLLLIPVTLIVVAWGMPTNFFPQIQTAFVPDTPQVASEFPDGAKLYVQHCANCHGERGDGNGITSLTTKARYFGHEPYKFTMTTGTKIPTDDTLIATIRRGIAGSSMPSFEKLSEGELRAIVAHLRSLTRKGMYAYLLEDAKKKYDEGGDDPDPVKLSVKADYLCQIGTPLPLPTRFAAASLASIANGRKVFLASCAACHGAEGRGDGQQVKDPNFKNANGTKAIPRNLTTGVFKGGNENEQLHARILLGIPGTPMPEGTTLTPQEVNDLINYVRSLSEQPVAINVASAGQ